MPKTVPTPVSAALGLVPTVLGGVRRLPTKAVQLPVLALSSALTGVALARREYDELSERGERLVAKLRGTSFDELEDKVEDVVARTPLAGAYDRAEDALEDAADTLRAGASKARAKVQHKGGVQLTVAEAEVPEAEQPKGVPTPKATEPDATRIDTAATPDVVAAVEEVVAEVAVPTDVTSSDLPLADYDHLTLGALRGRLRSLEVEQLVTLRTYEKSKADRLPVITMLDNRIAKLAAGEAAPSSGTVSEPSPKASAAVKPPKKVAAPATARTAAPQTPPHTKVRNT